MSSKMMLLGMTAISLGFFHTILGPDHYLPFVFMSKAKGWSISKTAGVTFLCGLGHILSSVLLGFIGIILGVAVFKLETIESFRGELAGWFLLGFGFTYCVWGLHQALRNKSHAHSHCHQAEKQHIHKHNHRGKHSHIHQSQDNRSVTPWILFTIFIFGPCEPLIPLLMYPAAKGGLVTALSVALVFGLTTIITMLGVVFIGSFGLMRLPLTNLEKYSHALAGLTIFLCGGAIKFLGL